MFASEIKKRRIVSVMIGPEQGTAGEIGNAGMA